MTGLVEISAPGVSGPQHLLIPESRPPRQPYAIPTDVPLTLPPLIMNSLVPYGIKTTNNNLSSTTSGMPSPPSSDCSYTARKQSPMSPNTTGPPVQGQYTPPYSQPETWPSQEVYTTMPSQHTADPMTYSVAVGALPVRLAGHRQRQQQTFDALGHGTPAMPAPSLLLGGQVALAPMFPAQRPMSTHQAMPPVIASGNHNYAAMHYGHSFQPSTGNLYLPAPNQFTWQPSPYHQPSYAQAQAWAASPQIQKPAIPETVFGRLPQAAWERVFQYLDYADRLRLQKVNWFWRHSLKSLDQHIKKDPSDTDYADMLSLVLEAENYRKHWSPNAAAVAKPARGRARNNNPNTRNSSNSGRKEPDGLVGNIGCYHCFRVLPPEKFALKIDEEDEGVADDDTEGGSVTSEYRRAAPRRYCLDCGIKKGYHPPNKYLETKAGSDNVIWICCNRITEYGEEKCPVCQRGCPLTPVNKVSRNSRKRSSPMAPPPSRRQRTEELHQGQYTGYEQQHQHAQWS